MNRPVRTWRCAIIPLLVTLVVTTVPLPCAAEGASQPTAGPSLKASIETAAATMATAKPEPARVAAAQAGGVAKPPSQKSFIKSPAGIAMIAILAAGIGYSAYSAKHDRTPVTGR